MMNKLIKVNEAKKLDLKTVKNYYKEFISKSQVDFFENFSFGNDLIEKAEGSFLYTKDKKILDLTIFLLH